MAALLRYPWPGNVRELEHVIERAVIITSSPELDLGDWQRATSGTADPDLASLGDVQRQHILEVRERTHGRVGGPRGAPRILGLKPTTLRSRMQKLGIHPRDAIS